MAEARFASHFLGNSGNGVRADLDFRAPARFSNRIRPCEHAAVRLPADGADGITTHLSTGLGIHMMFKREAKGQRTFARSRLSAGLCGSLWRSGFLKRI